jgi:hypothetical protein
MLRRGRPASSSSSTNSALSQRFARRARGLLSSSIPRQRRMCSAPGLGPATRVLPTAWSRRIGTWPQPRVSHRRGNDGLSLACRVNTSLSPVQASCGPGRSCLHFPDGDQPANQPARVVGVGTRLYSSHGISDGRPRVLGSRTSHDDYGHHVTPAGSASRSLSCEHTVARPAVDGRP